VVERTEAYLVIVLRLGLTEADCHHLHASNLSEAHNLAVSPRDTGFPQEDAFKHGATQVHVHTIQSFVSPLAARLLLQETN
jgi:hypothetical protein